MYRTCVPGVDDELGHLEGVTLHQPLTVNLHLAGVSDLRLTHHDLKGTVGHVFPVLLHAYHVFAHFLRRERDPCRPEENSELILFFCLIICLMCVRLQMLNSFYLNVMIPNIPMCLLGSLFSTHGSSFPDGALMLAVRLPRSVSMIFKETSVAVPTLS